MKFCDKLKQLRLDKSITQNDLADAIYISRSMIAKYESGAAYPTKDNIEKIAVYFNVSLSYLVDENETIQLSLESHKTINIVKRIILILGIIICLSFIIVAFIPILNGFKYVYPIPPGQIQPDKEYFTWSIVYATFINNNPIAIITVITCIINIGLYLAWFFLKSIKNNVKNTLFIISNVIFFTNIVLILISIILACSYVL